ncbi:diguanylate cyclase [Pectinatus haikarae]|uniref:Diguanylate cyclase (GGDEF)-like protein/hemerythrin-like metal-binding protein n=1 Tax=Pectinatus haikarae TaxID=349096 RepID=A0ABT9Y539_9FIRM|nr:diguanylate cyclase [Pectinatus haikarae]MDQ0202666.1 diguanylate cyclase (GGDEF)-like protein/hemerythrin-like metal-binding protein [Pectinatus haikarae]
MQLLHLDSDKLFSEKIKNIAQKNGFTYKRAISTNEVFEKFDTGKTGLLVIDEDIDWMLNNESVRVIISRDFICPPIIVITSKKDLRIKKKCFNMGIMGYFEKELFNSSRFVKYLKTIQKETGNIDLIRKIHIAVLDDSQFTLRIMRVFFDMHGINNVAYYQSPSEFLQQKMDYELFLIDLVLPEHDGDDIIEYIREKNQDAMIILMTAYTNENILAHCLSIGANDFILKPLEMKIFMARISSCINHYYLQREISIKNDQLFDMATRDSLTTLYNRAYFAKICEKKVKENLAADLPFSFILMDIDHFKTVNDQYGHLKGDYVLRELAKVLKENLRNSDIIGRWGGEEFTILMDNATVESSTEVAEKIREVIEKHCFNGIRQITVSIGVAQWQKGDDREILFRRLDHSLYLAKLTGRNKVVSNAELHMIQGDKPMTIEWGLFFKSGNDKIDADHSKLIGMLNKFIYLCFDKNKKKEMDNLLIEFAQEIVDHFDREEEILKDYKYQNYKDHKNVHAELVTKTLKLLKNYNDNNLEPINVAKYLVQEVVIGHIVRHDFNFYNIFTHHENENMIVKS